MLPEEEDFMPWGPNSTIFLAHMKPKMKLLCQILDATEDSDKDLLEKELLHLVCERYSSTNQISLAYSFNLLCPCGTTHQVSAEVFVLLEDVEAAWDSRVQKLYKVTGTKCVLFGPFLFSFCSRLAGQVENVEHVIKSGVELATKEDCEAFATIAEHTEQWGPLHIFVEHAIGEEHFWTALRRCFHTRFSLTSGWREG